MANGRKNYSIPCAHESSNVPTSQTVPDYHPLSYDEMRGLILTAFNDRSSAASIQCRLNQAIEGVVCPRQIDGPVAKKETEMGQAFVDSLRSGDASGAINKIGKILGLSAPKG
jgi:hypothetical protein